MSGLPDVTLTIVKFFSLFPTERWMFPQMRSKNAQERTTRKLFYPEQSIWLTNKCVFDITSHFLSILSCQFVWTTQHWWLDSFKWVSAVVRMLAWWNFKPIPIPGSFSHDRLPNAMTFMNRYEIDWVLSLTSKYTGQCLVKNFWFWTMI